MLNILYIAYIYIYGGGNWNKDNTEKPKNRWNGTTDRDKEIIWEGVDCTNFAKIGTDCGLLWARWWTAGFHKVWGDFLTIWGTVSFHRPVLRADAQLHQSLWIHPSFLPARICKCAFYGACLNITCQVHGTMSQVRPLYLVLDHTACGGRLVS
jgi:hypothetical protein